MGRWTEVARSRISKHTKYRCSLSPEDVRFLGISQPNPGRKQLTSGLALPGLLRPPCASAVITILHTHADRTEHKFGWERAPKGSLNRLHRPTGPFPSAKGKAGPAACRAAREINRPKNPVDQPPRKKISCCVLCVHCCSLTVDVRSNRFKKKPSQGVPQQNIIARGLVVMIPPHSAQGKRRRGRTRVRKGYTAKIDWEE